VVLQVSEYNMTFYIKVNLDNQTKGQKIGYCMVTTGQDFKFIVGAEQYLTTVFFSTHKTVTVLEMKIWIYWSESNSIIYLDINVFLNKN
jgi:hypothetical protein